jgi:hypothetical protein
MIYRKQGASVRWENGTLVRVTESGVAIEEGDVFTSRPEGTTSLSVDPAGVVETVRSIQSLDTEIERLVVSEGVAEHDLGGRTWRDETRRVHVSLVRDRVRALVDLGSFDLTDVRAVASSLRRLGPEREAPMRIRFARNVTAALLPALVGLEPPNVRLTYRIEPFRPSYRVRPVAMPANLRITCNVTGIEQGVPVAVAILEPVTGLALRVLVDDGETAWPATVRVTRIEAVAPDPVWYPYGGGSFGAEMML